MVHLAEDDNSGIKEWKAYSIDRLITSEVEEGKLSVPTIRIKLPSLQLARLSALIRERSAKINIRNDPVPVY
jgi:hypothetical protein